MGRKQLIARSKALPVLLQVGKNGLTQAFVEELCRAARKRGLVKVKVLPAAGELDLGSEARSIAAGNGLVLVSVVGRTAVFFDSRAPVKKQ